MSGNVANGPDRDLVGPLARAPRSPSRVLIGAVCIVALLTLMGASDTDELDLVPRALLWSLICGLLVPQVCVLDSLLARIAPPGLLGRFLAAVGAIAGVVVLMTPEMLWLQRTPLAPDAWGREGLLELGLFIAPQVIVMAGLVLVLRRAPFRGERLLLIEAQVRERLLIAAQPVIAGLLPPPRAAAELPDWPASEPVLWVKAHDHYLEVATVQRSVFIRARMRDATARLREVEGLQVHRSWWVAKDAVRGVRREGRDHILILQNGEEVPVGRARVGALRARGWL